MAKSNAPNTLTDPNSWTTGGVVKVGIIAIILYWLFGQKAKWKEVDSHLRNINR